MRPGRIPEEEAGGGGVAGAAMGAAGGAETARAKRRRNFRSAQIPTSSQHASLTPASSPFPGQHAALPMHVWHPIWRDKGCPAYTETQGLAASPGAKQKNASSISGFERRLQSCCVLQERVVQVSRVTKVVKGGKSMSFR